MMSKNDSVVLLLTCEYNEYSYTGLIPACTVPAIITDQT